VTRSPGTAAPRTDLPYLRHRTRPTQDASPTPVTSPAHVASSAHVASPALAQFVAGHGHHPPHAAPPTTAAPAAPPAVAVKVSSSLDLSDPAPTPPAAAVVSPSAPASRSRVRRVHADSAEILTAGRPTVTLSRVQSGIGALVVEAACSEAVGDLRLGAAYRLRSGASSVVQHVSTTSAAPPGSKRPLLVAHRAAFETLTVDLAQVRDLDRLAVYAFSERGASLAWGGTLVATTLGGSRVELPMDGPASAAVVVLLTIYNVEGELVLRAEPREPAGTVRDACLGFGFDRITWLDPQTPVT
jgi:hypothetical protein